MRKRLRRSEGLESGPWSIVRIEGLPDSLLRLASAAPRLPNSPRPQFLYTLSNPSLPRTLTGSFFYMYPFNRCIVRRSWWLSRLPTSSSAKSNASIDDLQEPKHGDEMVYKEAWEWPNSLMAYLASGIVFGFAGLFFASRWVCPCVALNDDPKPTFATVPKIHDMDIAPRRRIFARVRPPLLHHLSV